MDEGVGQILNKIRQLGHFSSSQFSARIFLRYTHKTSSYWTSSYKMSSYKTSIYQTSIYQTSRLQNVLITKRPFYQKSRLPNVQLPNVQLQNVHTSNYYKTSSFYLFSNKASVLFHEGMRKRGGLLVRCRPTIRPIHVWRVFADFSHFLVLVDKINPSQDTYIPI